MIFLPHLQGERAPYWDPGARGAFVGLSRSHGRAHLARAVLEGVAFCVRQLLDAGGVKPARVLVTGGGARSGLWNQIKADVLGVPFATLEVGETGVLGAAILAAVGTGRHDSLTTAARCMTRLDRIYQPLPGSSYEQSYRAFLALYPALKRVLVAETN